jgi:hypothetical protein
VTLDDTVTKADIIRTIRLLETEGWGGGRGGLDQRVDRLGVPYAHIAEEALREAAGGGLWRVAVGDEGRVVAAALRALSRESQKQGVRQEARGRKRVSGTGVGGR